jgi:F-type H+-transporting ATPase subunit delta
LNRSEPAARCYAEALLLLAKGKGRLEAVLEDLRGVGVAFRSVKHLWAAFTSPRVDRGKKEAAIRKAFHGRVGPEVEGLLVVMVRKGRESLYDNIVDQFERFKDLEQRRIHVHVSGARPVEAGLRAALEKAVADASGKDVVLHERTDPSLVAGLVVRVGDVLVDGSLRSRLRTLGTRLAGDRSR